ncbi:MAG: hypothetical protein GXP38_02005 [Chloroflexi bacterium]|nr:hypothetical protein [Chloroflexota bacterium]
MTKTPIAVLGSLAEFHKAPIPFDLHALVQLVQKINPDLLCLDIAPEQWRLQDFSDLPPEYREALLPLAYQTDIVVVPIGEAHSPLEPTARGWRGKAIAALRRGLAVIQKTAPGPDAINSGWRHDLANRIYRLMIRLDESKIEHSLHKHQKILIDNIVKVARRDPGARILVVVNVKYCHHIRPILRRYEAFEVKDYREL